MTFTGLCVGGPEDGMMLVSDGSRLHIPCLAGPPPSVHLLPHETSIAMEVFTYRHHKIGTGYFWVDERVWEPTPFILGQLVANYRPMEKIG